MALQHFLVVKILLVYLMNGCSNANTEVCKTSIGAFTHGLIEWEDNYYKVIMEKMTWFEARDACAEMGGVMVTPKSKNEVQFLAGIIPRSILTINFWINCNDLINEDIWECVGQTDIPYKAWSFLEIPGFTYEKDCGAVNKGGTSWTETSCVSPKHAVCTRPAPMLHL